MPGGLIENEVVHVFGGRHDGPIKPDPAEVERVEMDRARASSMADMRARPEAYTVWFRQYLAEHGELIAEWIGER